MSTRREGGYTLVEMLASLVIVGFAAAMLVSGLVTGRRVWEHADSANAFGETISGAQMLLREKIERAYPATRYDKIPTYADFFGAENSVTFLAPPRDIHAPQALMRYTLGLAANGDLVLSDLSDVAIDPKAPGEPLVLLRNVQQLDIAYYGVIPPDKAPAWHDSWQYRAVLPLLMRIRVQFPADDPRGWPELLIRPFAMVDTMCVLTAMTGKCRGRQ
ncbi:MAG: prepilin-type N-terminal cleavage/methylation domain-containing protein [Alphaproteobacteria bacterium]|nr:prepilin-type N-terminal cleavage/methylation domain-containing protein [Alphaproteobacteria bacterium]MBV9695281.1 prepilin-type N-terminal cleavage/methylation domain-containing protein [Alphaproteobacteria bacterium]